MKIVIIGGSGLIGTKLVDRVRSSQHAVVAASPQWGVNAITGEGLAGALKSADVIVDVSNSPEPEAAAALDFFQRSTMNLVTSASYAHVKHYIALSIVGSDRLKNNGYFRAKFAQEEIVRESGLAFTILRSTQFFELADRMVNAASAGSEVRIPLAAFQPIAADELVDQLEKIVFGRPENNTIEIAGPVAMPMYEFIRYYMSSLEDPRQLIADEEATYLGAHLDDESLMPGPGSFLGTLKYEDWFHQQYVKG